MDEIHHVTTFRCYRRTRAGEVQAVIIDVLDMGLDAPGDLRFSCHAITEDGRFAGGNPGRTLEEALAIVHWNQLDLPPEDTGAWKYWR
jgi:hypothetical protein